MPDVGSALLQVPPDLQMYGGKLMQIADDIDQKLLWLRQKLAPLPDLWISASRNEYLPVQEDWNVAATNFMTAEGTLGEIAQMMITNWNNYVECEGTNVANFRGSAPPGW
jgi:hypothetical protein